MFRAAQTRALPGGQGAAAFDTKQAGRRRKGLDAIVLNRPEAIGAERAAVEILVRAGAWQAVRLTTKSRLATRLIRLVERLHNDAS